VSPLRRSYMLSLTPSGRRAHRAAVEAFIPILERVVRALGPAEPSVRQALGALRSALDSSSGTEEPNEP
jgi:DNA-binding MarR family transcriptional regulator